MSEMYFYLLTFTFLVLFFLFFFTSHAVYILYVPFISLIFYILAYITFHPTPFHSHKFPPRTRIKIRGPFRPRWKQFFEISIEKREKKNTSVENHDSPCYCVVAIAIQIEACPSSSTSQLTAHRSKPPMYHLTAVSATMKQSLSFSMHDLPPLLFSDIKRRKLDQTTPRRVL